MIVPLVRTGCSVMVALGTMKDFLPQTASGTPMECPPPSTSVTAGFFMDATISAIASPASTSPPIVLRMSSRPSISRLSSTAQSSGIRCSYLVVFCV